MSIYRLQPKEDQQDDMSIYLIPMSSVDASRSWCSTQLPNGWTRDLNQYRFLIQSIYLQKASGQGVRTHPPMVLLAIVRERDINQLAFYQVLRGYSGIPFFFVRRCIYTASGVLFLSLMARRYFMFVMMTFGGGMVIVTLLAAVRNRGR